MKSINHMLSNLKIIEKKSNLIKLNVEQALSSACLAIFISHDIKLNINIFYNDKKYNIKTSHKGWYYRAFDVSQNTSIIIECLNCDSISKFKLFKREFNNNLITSQNIHDMNKCYDGRFFLENNENLDSSFKLRSEFRKNSYEIYKHFSKISSKSLDDILENLNNLYIEYDKIEKYTGNWWNYEIGIPKDILRQIRLLYDYLDINYIFQLLDSIYKFIPSYKEIIINHKTRKPETATGANFIDIFEICLWRDLFSGENTYLDVLYNDFKSQIKYVEEGDGIYRDGSYIQHHNYAYNGSYGEIFLKGVVKIIIMLNIINYPTTSLNYFIDEIIRNAYLPFLYDGYIYDAVRGRSISRKSNTGYDICNSLTYYINMFYEYIDNIARPNLDVYGIFTFNSMKRYLIKNYKNSIMISLSTDRMFTNECINGENQKSWYYSLGSINYNFRDVDMYGDAYYPTVCSKYIAGVTNSDKQLDKNLSGLSVDCKIKYGIKSTNYLAVAYRYISPFDMLKGSYSYFYFKKVLHVIGSKITYFGSDNIYHTIFNFQRSKITNYKYDNREVNLNINNSNYIFKSHISDIEIKKYENTNSYYDINELESKKDYTRDYLLCYIKLDKIKKFYYTYSEMGLDSNFIYEITDDYHYIKDKNSEDFVLNVFNDEIVIEKEGYVFKGRGCLVLENGTILTNNKTPIKFWRKK